MPNESIYIGDAKVTEKFLSKLDWEIRETFKKEEVTDQQLLLLNRYDLIYLVSRFEYVINLSNRLPIKLKDLFTNDYLTLAFYGDRFRFSGDQEYRIKILSDFQCRKENEKVAFNFLLNLVTTSFENQFPGLISSIKNNEDHFLAQIQALKLTSNEVLFLWDNVMTDHDKIISAIKTKEQFFALADRLACDNKIYSEFIKQILALNILDKCINTFDDVSELRRRNSYLMYNDSLKQDWLMFSQKKFSEFFENKYPGLISSLKNNEDDFLIKIQELKLTSREIVFLWDNIITDHDKVISLIKTKNDIFTLSKALKDEYHSYFPVLVGQIIASNTLDKCIHTFDDVADVEDKFEIYFGSSEEALRYKTNVSIESLRKLPALLQAGYSPSNITSRLCFIEILCAYNKNELLKFAREHKNNMLNWLGGMSYFTDLCGRSDKFSNEQFLVLAKELLPEKFPEEYSVNYKRMHPEVCVFLLKRISTKDLSRIIIDVLSLPSFNSEENKPYRNELIRHYLERKDIRVYDDRYDIKGHVESHYLESLKKLSALEVDFSIRIQIAAKMEMLYIKPENPLLFSVYSAWNYAAPEDQRLAMSAISFDPKDVKSLLSSLPNDIPGDQMYILAEALLKSPGILNAIMEHGISYWSNGFLCVAMPSGFVRDEYKEIFQCIESRLQDLARFSDYFIEMLNEKIETSIEIYRTMLFSTTAQYVPKVFQDIEQKGMDATFFGLVDKARSEDNVWLKLEEIFITERNQYGIGVRNDEAKQRSLKTIIHQIEQLKSSSTLSSQEKIIFANVLNNIKLEYKHFGLKEPAEKGLISRMMGLFSSRPSVQDEAMHDSVAKRQLR